MKQMNRNGIKPKQGEGRKRYDAKGRTIGETAMEESGEQRGKKKKRKCKKCSQISKQRNEKQGKQKLDWSLGQDTMRQSTDTDMDRPNSFLVVYCSGQRLKK